MPAAFASDIDDDSIIEELNKSNTKQLDVDFKLKSFDSCQAFEDVMEDYLKTYWENSYKNNRYRTFAEPMMLESVDFSADAEVSEESSAQTKTTNAAWGASDDFSKTNTQVAWVDESDIIKTNGKNIFYYNATKKAVYIMNTAKSAEELEVIKKINLPDTFYNPQLYVTDDRLVIVTSGYSQVDYSKRGYYINRNSKTYTIVFDINEVASPKLIKLHSSDGDFSKSRRVGDHLYIVSRNYFSYPYWNIKNVDDIEINAESFLPKQLSISLTDDEDEQNFMLKDKKLPYNVTAGSIAECNAISYNFPDEETIKNSGFNPGYNIITVLNINDATADVETEVIAGSNSEIYMSTNNLYMTEGIWKAEPFSCPADALCAMPFFWGGTQNTLVHKLSIDEEDIDYKDSALVPGSPLNQYSMDEYKGDFRIITSQWQPERSTGLYILDEDMELKSSLTNLAPGETFQSSRFIGEKLFLVTFEQIDPLFAIDLSDSKNPTVLGELKIPGFSTYLHPYDENHLIGLGYDTTQNQWGGTQTAGVKVDLYKINYDKKCGDSNLTAVQKEKCESGDYKGIIVEQLYTKTMGGKGSYSEALNNPRMFIWNEDRNTLLLPATLYEKDDNWRTTDYYDGLFSIKIDKDSGIDVKDSLSHVNLDGIEAERQKECEKYTGSESQPVCRELLNGEMHCETEQKHSYVPEYCYKDATVWQYIGDKSWQYRNMSVKRALYIGDEVYAISDSKIGSYDWDLKEREVIDFK